MAIGENSWFKIYWEDATPDATSVIANNEATGYEDTYLGPYDIDRRTLWKQGATGAAVVTAYWATAQQVLALGILNHNLTEVGSYILYARYSDNGSSWTAWRQPSLGALEAHDWILGVNLETHPDPHKWWQIYITGSDAPITIGRLFWATAGYDFSDAVKLPIMGSGLGVYTPTDVQKAASGISYRTRVGERLKKLEWIFDEQMESWEVDALDGLHTYAEGQAKSFLVMDPEYATIAGHSGRCFEMCFTDGEIWRRWAAGQSSFTLRMEEFR